MKRLLVIILVVIAPAALADFIGYCGNPTGPCSAESVRSGCYVPPTPSAACEPCDKCAMSPCYAATGVYATGATDLELDTIGFPITASRHYESSRGIDGETGYGWISSLSAHLTYTTFLKGGPDTYQKEAELLMPDGAFYRFTENSDGTFTPPKGRFDQLVKNGDGSFDLTLQRSRETMHFDATGKLLTMTDEYGNALGFTYTGDRLQQVQDNSGSGRSISVTWGADGRISDVTDMTGRNVHYEYDSRGVMTGVTDVMGQTTTYSYVAGRFAPMLSAVTDPWGRDLTTITYDPQSRTHSYTEEGETWTYTYAYNGDPAVTAKTDSAGNTWKFTYIADGLVTDRLAPGATVPTHVTYDANGLFLTRTDEMGKKTTYTYNADGSLASTIRDDGGPNAVEYRYTYDPLYPDHLTAITPYHPGTNQIDTKRHGWLTEYYQPGSPAPGSTYRRLRLNGDGTTTLLETYVNDAHGQVLSMTDTTGAVTNYGYNSAGDLISLTLPANNDGGVRPTYTYTVDALGRPTASTDPLGRVTTQSYDVLDRVISTTLPKPSAGSPLVFTSTAEYDQLDPSYPGVLFTKVTDPNGRITRYGSDAFGHTTAYIDAANIVTLYGWSKGLLVAINDANGNITTFSHDALGRMTAINFPDGQHETFTFNPDSTMLTRKDRRGQILTYTYDGLKRVTAKTYAGIGAINYIFDGAQIVQINDTTTSPGEVHTFTYDSSLLLTSETQATRGTLNYTYDTSGRLTGVTVAGGPATTFTYYPNSSPRTIQWSPLSGNFTYAYALDGAVTSITYPNGQARLFTYDDLSRVTQLDNVHPAAGHLATFNYAYDTDATTGLPTVLNQRSRTVATIPSQSLTGAETDYNYDALYRLTRAQYPTGSAMNGETHAWTYDAIGNRLTSTIGATTRTYGYQSIGTNTNAWWRMTSDAVNAYAYDAAGNTTSLTGYTFNWDHENRLSSVGGNVTATYRYDYTGRRSAKTAGSTTQYLYNGPNILRENGTTITDYVYGAGIDEPLAMSRGGVVSYFDVDDENSVVATNAADGTVLNNYQYDAWGDARQVSETVPQPFRFTGREAGDVPGQNYFRARFLSSATGRFLSEDPLSFTSDDDNPAGLWSYTYGVDNPIAYMDPTGLRKQTKHHQPKPKPHPKPAPKNCPCDQLKKLVHSRNQCPVIDDDMVLCMVITESSGAPLNVNGSHVGLMAVGDEAVKQSYCVNIDRFNPAQNVGCGTAYLCNLYYQQPNIRQTLRYYRIGGGKDPKGWGAKYPNTIEHCTECIGAGFDCDQCNPYNPAHH